MGKQINNTLIKIRPTWELGGMDDKGNMFFEHTQDHKGNISPMDEKLRNRASRKILKELESRMKL